MTVFPSSVNQTFVLAFTNFTFTRSTWTELALNWAYTGTQGRVPIFSMTILGYEDIRKMPKSTFTRKEFQHPDFSNLAL
ncbi:hypothetical protein [Methanosarcina sp.]|uniref:hypothetical protein n=1 Tax=Methanosarcina sp. TaxID=2213 RepID=UPI002988F1A4|nr:hypothetical protein [Methanosarcina sp.]MDW5551036.1 hypothetical protein [Methanosarcina sp.]MDW5555006.1 hypothetical protein [Methanosarcina sp.]MDW5558406.1 hypothetical protein [Methanosarcina sp.]